MVHSSAFEGLFNVLIKEWKFSGSSYFWELLPYAKEYFFLIWVSWPSFVPSQDLAHTQPLDERNVGELMLPALLSKSQNSGVLSTLL